jgi:hypothetical protein
MITQEQLKEILHYDECTGVFVRIGRSTERVKIGDIVGSVNLSGYVIINIDGDKFRAHRLAFLYMTGEFPKNMVDHIDGVRDNNRWGNLREATSSENMQNQIRARIDNKSGFLGVTRHKPSGRFAARIQLNGKVTSLGYYDTPEEAHEIYLVEKRKIHPRCTL